MIQSLIASALLSFSIGAKSLPVTVPVTHDFITKAADSDYEKSVYIHGAYSFRQNPSYSFPSQYYSHRYTFEDITPNGGGPYYKQLVPISIPNVNDRLYLRYFDIEYDDGYCTFDFYCYNGQEDLYTYSTSWSSTLENVTYRALMFNVNPSFYIGGTEGWFFDNYFTLEGNAYVTTYTGYYSFSQGLTDINSKFAVYGTTMFNNILGTGLTNYVYTSDTFGLYTYDTATGYYDLTTYTLPFNSMYVSGANVNFVNAKMTNETKTLLESVGIFSYQQDNTYNDATFNDLLFSVVDSPIYMISRILNFELFGVNLFIALTGLLTIVVIVMLVRKLI